MSLMYFFFFNDTATTEIYTLSLHDALPIYPAVELLRGALGQGAEAVNADEAVAPVLEALGDDLEELGLIAADDAARFEVGRSEEHTSELQSRQYLVCRLLLEKKKKTW